MSGTYTMADVRATYPDRAAWWTVVFVDPLAGRLVLPIANRTSITPSQLTVLAAVLGFGAAGAFLEGSRLGLIVGAVLFHLSYMIDCMDGKLARLKGAVSLFGAWLDYVLDRFKVAACTVGLMTGQFHRTDRTIYLFLAIAVLFGEMFRQLHAAYSRDLNQRMADRSELAPRDGDVNPPNPPESVRRDQQVAPPWPRSRVRPPATRHRRPGGALYDRLRGAALARRIRPHLWSGIEFEAFVFVVGPLSGAVIQVTVASSLLLAAFEVGAISKLWIATKRADRNNYIVTFGSESPDAGQTATPDSAAIPRDAPRPPSPPASSRRTRD